MKKFIIAGLSITLSMFSIPTFASTQSVVKGCISGGDCLALVKAEIATFKGTPAEKDRKIAALVAALVNASTGTNQSGIAKGIAYAGSQSANSQQRQQIASIASAVNNCLGPLGSCLTETASDGQQAQGNSSNVTSSNGKQSVPTSQPGNPGGTTPPSAPTPPAAPPATPPAPESPPAPETPPSVDSRD